MGGARNVLILRWGVFFVIVFTILGKGPLWSLTSFFESFLS